MSDELPDGWRAVLECRSTKDKIALPRHCELAPVDDLPLVAAMVREGYLTFLDNADLPMAAKLADGSFIVPINCDIYMLTDLGVALCDKHGIKQR